MQVFGDGLDVVSEKFNISDRSIVLTGNTGGNTVESKALKKLTIDNEMITTSLCRPRGPPGSFESMVTMVGQQLKMNPNEGPGIVLCCD